MNDKPIAYIHTSRKDGKTKVEFVFPITGKRITKLIDAAELKAKTEDKGFVILYA